MGLVKWFFNFYILITVVRTAEKWTTRLVTRQVYTENETLAFSEINFVNCTATTHKMCRNIVRSHAPVEAGGYPYKIDLVAFSRCRDVAFSYGMIGGDVQWARQAEVGGAYKVLDTQVMEKNPFYGAREFLSFAKSDYRIEFALWFDQKLPEETFNRCMMSRSDDPYFYWHYTITVDSPLAYWTGYDWLNIFSDMKGCKK